MKTTILNFGTKTLIAISLILVFSSCSKDDTFQSRELNIYESYVEIDGQRIDFDVDMKANSDNYNVMIYDGMIHVVSLSEYFIKIDQVNQPYTILEDGLMYFMISDNVSEYPLTIKFTVAID